MCEETLTLRNFLFCSIASAGQRNLNSSHILFAYITGHLKVLSISCSMLCISKYDMSTGKEGRAEREEGSLVLKQCAKSC